MLLSALFLSAAAWTDVDAVPVAPVAVPFAIPVALEHPGAAALGAGYVDRVASGTPAIPPIDRARVDWVDYDDRCTYPKPGSTLRRCRWIDPASPGSPVVLVVGDSHMQQFLPAVGPAARKNGWGVDAIIRGACPFSVNSETVPGSVECTAWNRAAIDEIVATRPAAVVAGASRNVRVGHTEVTPPGFLAAWGILARHDIPMLVVRDNPRYDFSPTACLVTRGRDSAACEVPRDAIYGVTAPIESIMLPPTVHYLDTADLICGPITCAPEVGNVLLYMDDNHMAASYTATMAPEVGRYLEATLRR